MYHEINIFDYFLRLKQIYNFDNLVHPWHEPSVGVPSCVSPIRFSIFCPKSLIDFHTYIVNSAVLVKQLRFLMRAYEQLIRIAS